MNTDALIQMERDLLIGQIEWGSKELDRLEGEAAKRMAAYDEMAERVEWQRRALASWRELLAMMEERADALISGDAHDSR